VLLQAARRTPSSWSRSTALLPLTLTRQSAIYAREGVEIDVSTLADWVGAAAATAM